MADNDNNSNNSMFLFERFFQRWMQSQERYLDELLTMEQQQQQQRRRNRNRNRNRNGNSTDDDDDDDDDEKVVTDLISRVLTHYQLYYEEKSGVVEKNVFVVLSPPWLTPLERTFLWVGGFKPGLAFRIVNEAVGELSEEQRRRMSLLQEETRTEERALSDDLARIQESVAAPPLMALARLAGGRGRRDGVISGCDQNLTELLSSGLKTVVKNAELLRTTTALKVVDILTPLQSVRFLGAVGRLHIKIRTWGGLQTNTPDHNDY